MRCWITRWIPRTLGLLGILMVLSCSQLANADFGIVGDLICTDCVGSEDIDDATTTDTKCIWFENPTDADDFLSIWTANGFAVTITKIWCESDILAAAGGINLDLSINAADVNGADLDCDDTPAEDEAMGGDATLADGQQLDLVITSIIGVATWVSVCWTYTVDD